MIVKHLDVDAKTPVRKSVFAAGFDISSSEAVAIEPGKRVLIKTGISIELPRGTWGLLKSRSGLALQYIDVQAGVIDQDYKGEIMVLLHNSGTEYFHVKKGDRIAQMIVQPFGIPNIYAVDQFVNKAAVPERGTHGFGSTGMN
jgi:dUTP pyrophosphatase